MEVIRNGKVLYRKDNSGYLAEFQVEDTMPARGTNWYYARVLQRDGQMAWSSPVWVDLQE
jgi:hypothetical protein